MPRAFMGLVLVFAALLVAACSSARYSLPTTEELRQTGRFSEPELESLEEGRIIGVTECADCHRMYWPAEKPSEEWPGIMHAMADRSGLEDADVEHLSFYFSMVSDAVERNELFWLPEPATTP
ncbi:MAG: hypothetical protein AAF488_06450 [Planctomycetota bacterium]